MDFKVAAAFLLIMTVSLPALGWKNASPSSIREKIPYRPQWVSVLKKGRLFKYKRKEFSSPRINNDMIFVGSDGGFFYAMKKKNGRKVWRFKTTGSVNSSPTFSDSRVFFGDDEGLLYALEIADGKQVWKTDLGSEILTAPAVLGSRLFVATVEGKVAALSVDDGRLLWENEHRQDGFKMTIRGNSPPVVDSNGDRLFVGFADGTLRCLAAATGKSLWEKDFKKGGRGFDDIDGAPLIDGDRLYIASFDGGIYALSKQNGAVLWNQPNGSGVPMLVRGDVLYVSGSDGRLYAYGKKDGSKLWDSKIGDGALTGPVSYKDLLAVGLSDETMTFIDSSDGHIIARRFARKGVFSDPILDENRIYYLSNGGRIYSLKLLR